MFKRTKKRIELYRAIAKHEASFALARLSCDECGLVFGSEYFLKKHRKETGHKEFTAQEQVFAGINRVFESAAEMNRSSFYEAMGRKENNTADSEEQPSPDPAQGGISAGHEPSPLPPSG